MKYIVLLLMLFNAAFAQHISVDKLTGDTSITTDAETLYSAFGAGVAGEKLECLVTKNNNTTFLSVIGRTGKTDALVFPEGSELNLKLSDNSIITLKNLKSTTPTVKTRPFGQYWTTIYLLDDETKNKLINASVSYIRLNHSNGYLEYDIKDKRAALISKCVKQIK